MTVAGSVILIADSAYFKALYNLVPSPVLLLHKADGLILAANPAFIDAFGLPELKADTEAARLYPASGSLPWNIVQGEEGQKVAAKLALPGQQAQAVEVTVAEAMLAGNSVLLCFVQGQQSTRSQQTALVAAEAEKKALLNEVYHRVKNNLNIIISLLKLQLNRVEDPEFRKLLLESKSRIFTLALLQERLYLSPRLSEVKANEYLIKLADSVIHTFKGRQQISLKTDTAECWLKVDSLVPLGLLVHELVSNAVLHAFTEQEKGTISLSFGPAGENSYQLTIADDGKGMAGPEVFDAGKTLGIQLINSLTKQLKASKQLETSAGAGTRIIVKFAKPLS
ncbi:sensor histidine kinase [Cesiribacter sp. SM1]|uniref:sensor histidine kinase n=1 Tax=Cesiribacter sp. SM1 TaxID=2861196 RepID=UPI001CD706B1|nr:sensor histidine kinase [Cesiribacter sp. SM1]